MLCGETYRGEAEVDSDAGDTLVECIKPFAALTLQDGVEMLSWEGFGAVFDLAQIDYEDPLLVSTEMPGMYAQNVLHDLLIAFYTKRVLYSIFWV
jgi:phosphoribosylaminoimidazole (AIR) synthetase